MIIQTRQNLNLKIFKNKEKGSVFISALVLILGFSAFLVSHSFIAANKARNAIKDQNSFIASQKAISGINILTSKLIDAKINKSLTEFFASNSNVSLSQGGIKANITELSGRLNIRDIGNTSMPKASRMIIVRAFFNLLKKADMFSQTGVDGEKALMRKFILAGKIRTTGELVLKGIIPKELLLKTISGTSLRLIDAITTFGQYKTELNSISKTVLSSFPSITDENVKSIITKQNTGTEEKAMLSLIPETMREAFKASPSLFKIESTGKYKNTSVTYIAVFEFDGTIPRFYKYIRISG
jgi:hypothetical protein